MLSVWRSTITTFWRLPLLVLGSILLYVALSAYWMHYKPFHLHDRLVSENGYLLLHGLIFAPLILAVMQMVVYQNERKFNVWTVAVIRVGLIIIFYSVIDYAVTFFARTWWNIAIQRLFENYTSSDFGRVAAFYQVYALIKLGLFIGFSLLSIRLCLLLPISMQEAFGFKVALKRAWRDMRGHYLFALAVSCAVLLPLVIFNYFTSHLYRRLADADLPAARLSLAQWEALLLRSAQLTFEYILIAALAATLYRMIEARTKATAP